MNLHIEDINAAAGRIAPGQKVAVWVPSVAVTVHQVPIPKAPRRKWATLLPWMLEERLLQPPEQLHFVIAGHDRNRLSVLVTAKTAMHEWQESLTAAGITDYGLYPDFLALPWQPDSISVGLYADHILVRYGRVEGFSARPAVAWLMLDKLLEQAGQSEGDNWLALYMPEQNLPEQFREKVKLRQHGIDWQLAAVVKETDLLSGEFALRRAAVIPRAWMATAALVILGIMLSYLSLTLGNQRLAEEVLSLQEQNRTAFFNLFPGLSIRSGSIRTTVEDFIGDRFLQRDSLAADAMQTLLGLDEVLADCNCDLQGLNLTQAGLELRLPLAAADRVESWQIRGFEKQLITGADEGLTLVLNRESER